MGHMLDLFDEAPAWVLPQLYFGVNWDECQHRLKPQRWPESWDDYPIMPMLLPESDLFLRFCVVQDDPDNPFSRRLMLLLQAKSHRGVLRCQAWRVSSSLAGLLALANMLIVDPRGAEPVPVPPDLMPAFELSRPQLLQSLSLDEAVAIGVWEALHTVFSVGSGWDRLILFLPSLILDQNLWRGSQYLIGSLRLFTFMGDDMRDTYRDHDSMPDSPYALIDAESAVWLAYKAVESVIGDPSSDAKRLQRHLSALGLSDFPGVWRHEKPFDLVQRVTEFVSARDKRTAHGRHHARRAAFSYFEIMDYQYFASALLVHCAQRVLREHRLPDLPPSPLVLD